MKHSKSTLAVLAGVTALAVGACSGSPSSAPATATAKPSTAASASTGYTPPNLAGKSLVFGSLGGAYQAAEDTAFIKPFMAATGATVTDLQSWTEATLTQSVQAGKPLADVIDMDTTVSAAHCGTDLMPIDTSIVDLSKVDQTMIASKCGAPIIRYGFGIYYSTKKYGTSGPQGCADFFDTTKFPGTRGVMGSAIPNQILECALIADGVPAANLYPLDLTRAFKKINSIKSSIKFWQSGAESQDLMTSGEVDMLMAWSGRAYTAIEKQSAAYAAAPNDLFILSDDLTVPKGVADPTTAMQLIQFMMQPSYQAELTKLIPYTPSRVDAVLNVDAALQKYLVSNSSYKTVSVNQKWWADNTKAVQTAWDQNITQ